MALALFTGDAREREAERERNIPTSSNLRISESESEQPPGERESGKDESEIRKMLLYENIHKSDCTGSERIQLPVDLA